MLWFLLQCEKLVDPDSRIEGQPACDLRAVGKKFDKGLYTTLVSTQPCNQCLNTSFNFSPLLCVCGEEKMSVLLLWDLLDITF